MAGEPLLRRLQDDTCVEERLLSGKFRLAALAALSSCDFCPYLRWFS